MNTQLSDLFHRDVEGLTPDLDSLTTVARRRGLAIRRRRQALSTLSAAAAVAVIAVGATQLQGDTGAPGAATAPAKPTPTATPSPLAQADATTPITGEATAAGLRDLLAEVARGRATSFAGQDSAEFHDSYGELRWFPADGSGFSDAGLNVQPGFDKEDIYRCGPGKRACTVTLSKAGGTLMTYEEVTKVDDGDGIQVVADLLRPDGVRVVAFAKNGEDLPSNQWRITRPRPAFTAEQLVRVVSQPWWGPEVPAKLQQEGKALPGYTDRNEDVEATPLPVKPTS